MSVLNEPPILTVHEYFLVFFRLEDGSPTLPYWRKDANNFAQAASGETSPATVAINVF